MARTKTVRLKGESRWQIRRHDGRYQIDIIISKDRYRVMVTYYGDNYGVSVFKHELTKKNVRSWIKRICHKIKGMTKELEEQ